MEMDSQNRRESRIGGIAQDVRANRGEGRGKGETKPSVKRVSRKDLKAKNDTGVRMYQVAVYESIMAAS